MGDLMKMWCKIRGGLLGREAAFRDWLAVGPRPLVISTSVQVDKAKGQGVRMLPSARTGPRRRRGRRPGDHRI